MFHAKNQNAQYRSRTQLKLVEELKGLTANVESYWKGKGMRPKFRGSGNKRDSQQRASPQQGNRACQESQVFLTRRQRLLAQVSASLPYQEKRR